MSIRSTSGTLGRSNPRVTDLRATDLRLTRLCANAMDLMQRIEKAAEAGNSLPDEETVHRLRTGTRRCGALLESLLHDGRTNLLQLHAVDAHKLLRQWKKLRRAAGTVRDLDVHHDLLQELRRTLAKSGSVTLDSKLVEQLDHLDAWLAEQRLLRARTLHKQAVRRVQRCRELASAVLGPLDAPVASTPPGQASVPARKSRPALLALDDFYAVSMLTSLLERDNLHDFRKSTKEARYVAEAGGDDPHAQAVSKALKRIQDAIGDWHDLDALCIEARHALAGEGTELRDHLHNLAEEKLHAAIQATERMRRRLLGERLAMQV